MQRRTLIHRSLAASALVLGGSFAAQPAVAQGAWPTGKPITYMVP
jgi:hypothetical protein